MKPPPDASPLPAASPLPWRRLRRTTRLTLVGIPVLVIALLLGPLAVVASGEVDPRGNWRGASRASAGFAPAPLDHPEAVVQVYAARTVAWRGAFGVHPWIAVKRPGEASYTTWQVLGWRTMRGLSNVVASQTGQPDGRWFGAMPMLLADRRGPAAEALIDRIEAAVQSYPFGDRYRAWPGPNSNTFAAHVARLVPELRLDLPAHAIGKDYLGPDTFIARAPSGTGWQWSAWGLLGLTAGLEEGVEANLLGLSFGIDFKDRALRLPGIGRLGPPLSAEAEARPAAGPGQGVVGDALERSPAAGAGRLSGAGRFACAVQSRLNCADRMC